MPITTFNEITVFQNPYFRPLVEIVDDFDSLSSTKLSEAEILGFDASHIELVTTMNPAGYLIVKWFNSSDWRCFLDGNATPISENK